MKDKSEIAPREGTATGSYLMDLYIQLHETQDILSKGSEAITKNSDSFKSITKNLKSLLCGREDEQE